MNEFTALKGILAPGTGVYGYQRGDAVAADVVTNWGLAVGDEVCEGDLDESESAPLAVSRPGPEANRAAWESWAIANGMGAEDAAVASMEDLEAVGAEPAAVDDPARPADSANKAAWIEYAVSRGLPRDGADAYTKAELQAWEPTVGDTVAIAATEANQG